MLTNLRDQQNSQGTLHNVLLFYFLLLKLHTLSQDIYAERFGHPPESWPRPGGQ